MNFERISVDPKDGTVSCKCRAYGLVSTCCHVEEYIRTRPAPERTTGSGLNSDVEAVSDTERDRAIAVRNRIGRLYGMSGLVYGNSKTQGSGVDK